MDAPPCHDTAARLADYSGAQYYFIPGKGSSVPTASGLGLGESEAATRETDIGLYNFSDSDERLEEMSSSGPALPRDCAKPEQSTKVSLQVLSIVHLEYVCECDNGIIEICDR